jgi:hypothetical protein
MFLRNIMLEVVSCAEVSRGMGALSVFVEVRIESLDSITKESFYQM